MSVPGARDLPCTIFSNSCTPYAANGNQSTQRTKVVHARQDIVPQICPTFKHMWGGGGGGGGEYSKTLASLNHT